MAQLLRYAPRCALADAMHPSFRHCPGPFSKALILENPDPILDGLLGEMGIEAHRVPDAPEEREIVRLLAEGQHDLVFKRSKTQITQAIVQASDRLAAVMLCCIGDDSVDKRACADHGVLVLNDPVSNGRSVAELVIGELVSLSRRLFESVPEMDRDVWRKDSHARYELRGKRLGILGLGAIGRQVAQLGESFGMEIRFFDSALVPREVGVAMGWQAADTMEGLFREADFVTAHLSSTDVAGRSNENVVSYEMLRAMGQKDYEGPRIFLNLARGLLVRPDDLRRAVSEGHVTYAMTDVFPDEPRKATETAWRNPYADEPRIFATPHIGAATREAQPRIAQYMARTTHLLSAYGMLRNCVFRPRASIQFEVEYARSMLAVVHVDKRGTKKAVDEAIYDAGANNVRSAHIDFPNLGVAYDLSALDRELTHEQAKALAVRACEVTGDPTAIRLVRTLPLG